MNSSVHDQACGTAGRSTGAFAEALGDNRRCGLLGGDSVELADVPEGERPQERTRCRGRIGSVEPLADPPCRSSAMSSMLSAPAIMPATSEVTERPAFAPVSVATERGSSPRVRNPASWAASPTGSVQHTRPDSSRRRTHRSPDELSTAAPTSLSNRRNADTAGPGFRKCRTTVRMPRRAPNTSARRARRR